MPVHPLLSSLLIKALKVGFLVYLVVRSLTWCYQPGQERTAWPVGVNSRPAPFMALGSGRRHTPQQSGRKLEPGSTNQDKANLVFTSL